MREKRVLVRSKCFVEGGGGGQRHVLGVMGINKKVSEITNLDFWRPLPKNQPQTVASVRGFRLISFGGNLKKIQYEHIFKRKN